MIILYARFSKVEALDPTIAKEDCALALKLVPELRWRWERQDNKGSHPLIARLAYKLLDGFNENPKAKPMLIDENYWVPQHMLLNRAPPNLEELFSSPPRPADVPLPPTGGAGGISGVEVISIPQSEQNAQHRGSVGHYHGTQPMAPSSSTSMSDISMASGSHPSQPPHHQHHSQPQQQALPQQQQPPPLVNFDHFNAQPMHYFPQDASAPGRLMQELAYQQAPTTYNLQHMAAMAAADNGGDVDGMGMGLMEHQHVQRAAAGHVPGGADPDEKYEIWQSRHTYDPYHRSHDY